MGTWSLRVPQLHQSVLFSKTLIPAKALAGEEVAAGVLRERAKPTDEFAAMSRSVCTFQDLGLYVGVQGSELRLFV